MKKLAILLVVLMLFPLNAFAASGSFSVTSTLTVTANKTNTFTIKANNCAGKFEISSSNSSVASISSTSIWLDNNSETITVKGLSVGTAKITVRPVDVSDYDENSITGAKTVTVTVKAAATQAPVIKTTKKITTKPVVTTPRTVRVETTSPVQTTTISTTTTVPYNENEDRTTTKVIDDLITTSPSLLLDEVIVEGFKVSYKNGVFYSIVNSDTESVMIHAKAKENLTVKGDGYRKIAPGVNSVELQIFDRSGNQQSAFLIITRPDGNSSALQLAELKVVGYDLEFKPGVLEYTVEVPKKTNDVYVVAIASDPEAIITGDGMTYLKDEKTDINVSVTNGGYGNNIYVIHVVKTDSMFLYFILIGGLSAGIIGALAYIIVKKKNWKSLTEQEKQTILSNESKQVSVNGEVEINGEERKIGERIIKPTLVNTISSDEHVVKPVQVVKTVTPINEVKVEAARPVKTVTVHPEVAPKIVKTTNVAPQVKVVPTHNAEENKVVEEQITTTIKFD